MSFPASISKHREALFEILGEAFRDPARRSVVKTRGVSMEPFLRARDEVVLRALPVEEIRPGDLIGYRSGELLIVHRVAAVVSAPGGLLFYERGDNSLALTPVASASVLGVVTEVVAGARRLELRQARFRWLGAGIAAWGLRAVRVYMLAGQVGVRVLEPGTPLSRVLGRVLGGLLQGPPRIALRLARRWL